LHSNDGSGQRAHGGHGGHFAGVLFLSEALLHLTAGQAGQTGGTTLDFKM
jgi:hypothetical protein